MTPQPLVGNPGHPPGEVLVGAVRRLPAHADAFAEIEARGVGRTSHDTRREAERAAGAFGYFGGEDDDRDKRDGKRDDDGKKDRDKNDHDRC